MNFLGQAYMAAALHWSVVYIPTHKPGELCATGHVSQKQKLLPSQPYLLAALLL